MLSESELLENLFSKRRFNIIPGLERTNKLAEYCGNPQLQFKIIHIAGTNGKGSSANMIASILDEAGYNIGIYTSPHIYKFNERIQTSSGMIQTEDLIRIAEFILPYADEIGATFFEITTVMALKYFAEKKIDYAVIECGMGGKNDSTNIVHPIISLITHIALDHTEYLGSSIEAIAEEKAGIIKSNSKAIISDLNPTLFPIFKSKAIELSSDIIFASYSKEIQSYYIDENLWNIYDTLTFGKIEVPLAGEHQANNLAGVLEVAKILTNESIVTHNNITDGLSKIKSKFNFSARTELISKDEPVVIDAAHNPDSVKALVSLLKSSQYKELDWILVFAVMGDKDINAMLQLLSTCTKEIYIVQLSEERSASAEAIKQLAINNNFSKVQIYQNAMEAYSSALKTKKPILVTGSFYLISEIKSFDYFR